MHFKTMAPVVLVPFLTGSLYGLSLVFAETNLQTSFSALVPVLFFVSLCGIFISNSRCFEDFGLRQLILISVAYQLGFLLCESLSINIYRDLWVVDSRTMHVPSAANISNWLFGIEPIRNMSSGFDRIYLTQVITGIFFFLFGVHPVSSGLALTLIKVFTLVGQFKFAERLFDRKVALLAAFVYISMPTVFFYTTAFYKEAMIQCLTVWLSYTLWTFYQNRFSPKYLPALIALLLLLSVERFYIVIFFLATMGLKFLIDYPMRRIFKAVIFVVSAVVGSYVFLLQFKGIIAYDQVFKAIRIIRNGYLSYPDVNSEFNKNLWYPIAIVKLFFSPYFTFNKFSIFSGHSYLLIWGAFLNQVVLGLFAWSMIKFQFWKKHWVILLPFLFLILFFAYLAPYSGRVRDSFYPIIAIYAAYLAMQLSGKRHFEKS